jgi:hypothetical protein
VANVLGWLFVACVFAAVLIPAKASYTQVTAVNALEIDQVESRTVTCTPALPFVSGFDRGRPPQVGDRLLPGSSAWLRANACGVTRGERYQGAFSYTLLAALAFHTARRRQRDFTVERILAPRKRGAGEKAAALLVLIVAIPLLLATVAAAVFAAADGESMMAGSVGAVSAVLAVASVKAWRILQMP